MAKTVSRSGDNGESTPVPVNDLGGHIEDHKADAVDVSAARATIVPSFKGMNDIQTSSWIENLMDAATIFSSPKGSFKLTANGFHGSVQPIDEAIRRDAFVLRAVQRGRIRFLGDDEASNRINELVDQDQDTGSHLDHLMESLGANASENTGLYKIPLPDEAEPKGPSQSPAEIWAKSENKPESPKNFKQHVKSGTTDFTL
jgi:hypothetical protein